MAGDAPDFAQLDARAERGRHAGGYRNHRGFDIRRAAESHDAEDVVPPGRRTCRDLSQREVVEMKTGHAHAVYPAARVTR